MYQENQKTNRITSKYVSRKPKKTNRITAKYVSRKPKHKQNNL